MTDTPTIPDQMREQIESLLVEFEGVSSTRIIADEIVNRLVAPMLDREWALKEEAMETDRIAIDYLRGEVERLRSQRAALWDLLKRQTRRLGRWRRWTMDASTEIERLRDLGQQTSGWERQATPNMPSHRPPATEATDA